MQFHRSDEARVLMSFVVRLGRGRLSHEADPVPAITDRSGLSSEAVTAALRALTERGALRQISEPEPSSDLGTLELTWAGCRLCGTFPGGEGIRSWVLDTVATLEERLPDEHSDQALLRGIRDRVERLSRDSVVPLYDILVEQGLHEGQESLDG